MYSGGTLILFTKTLVLGSIEWIYIRRKREDIFRARGGLCSSSTPLRSSPALYTLEHVYTHIHARVSAIIAIRDKVPRVIIYSGKHLGKKYRLRLLSTDLTLIYTPLSTGITAYYDPNGRSNFFTVTCFEIFAAFSTPLPRRRFLERGEYFFFPSAPSSPRPLAAAPLRRKCISALTQV